MEEEGHDKAIKLMGEYDTENDDCCMGAFVFLEMYSILCVFLPKSFN